MVSLSPACGQEHGGIDRSHGGVVATGDLGFVHEGQLYVVGRLKDVIIVGVTIVITA